MAKKCISIYRAKCKMSSMMEAPSSITGDEKALLIHHLLCGGGEGSVGKEVSSELGEDIQMCSPNYNWIRIKYHYKLITICNNDE